MARKTRPHGCATLPTCPTCGLLHPPEDTVQRELCESFALFREALTPEFGAFIAILPAGYATPLVGAFKTQSTIDALSSFLLQLQETNKALANLEASRRIYLLNKTVDRILRSTDFASLDELKCDIRRDYENIVGKRYQLLLQEFERSQDVQILIELLRSRVNRWRNVVDHRRLLAATLLMQTITFAISNTPREPEAAASQVNLPIPLAQGA